jgi:hypothetical protein
LHLHADSYGYDDLFGYADSYADSNADSDANGRSPHQHCP